MAISAASAAARSIFRSSPVRNAAARLGSSAKPSRAPFFSPSRSPLAYRVFRSPVEMSACLETILPYHTATASALMTSLLTVSRCGYAWLPEGLLGALDEIKTRRDHLASLARISPLNSMLDLMRVYISSAGIY